MSEVKPADQTLQNLLEVTLSGVTINLEKPQTYKIKFNENRNELQNSILNFMNLVEPIKINFLNLDDKLEESKVDDGHFTVQMSLTTKVFI